MRIAPWSPALAFALLIAGCGFEPAPTGPEDPGSTISEPPFAEPEFAAAATNLWTTKASMPTPRHLLGVGVVNGVIYTVGGYNGSNQRTTAVQAYNPSTNTWTTKAPLPSARNSMVVGSINGVLYVAGGGASSGTSTVAVTTLYAYNPSTNTWTTKAPMRYAGACGAGGVISGKLYVYTGCNYPGPTFQRYDPVTNSWALLPLPSGLHGGAAAGVIGGKLYLAGGNNFGVPSAVVESYDPSTNTWTPRPAMRSARGGGAGVVIDGLLYVVGGTVPGDTLAGSMEVYNPVSAT